MECSTQPVSMGAREAVVRLTCSLLFESFSASSFACAARSCLPASSFCPNSMASCVVVMPSTRCSAPSGPAVSHVLSLMPGTPSMPCSCSVRATSLTSSDTVAA